MIRFSPGRLLALLFVLVAGANGVDEKAAANTGAGSAADAAWAAIEKELAGPTRQPESREEAMVMMKAHITRIDRLAEDFTAKYPADPRRWTIVTQLVSTYPIRERVGLPSKTMADARKVLAGVLEAKDADAGTRAEASFRMVTLFGAEHRAGGISLADLQKAVEAHRGAFPEHKGNAQLERMLAAAKTVQELRTRPLELKFTALDGRAVDLSQMRGKVVLVKFWATWCAPCVAEIPNLVRAYEKLHSRGFEIVGISFDQEKAKLEAMVKEQGMSWPQYFDGKGEKNELGERFGVPSLPQMWLVDKRGMVADTEAGKELEAKVEKLLAE